jgi:hypothetical protein
VPKSEETITDGRRFGGVDKLDNLYGVILFRILAAVGGRVIQILPNLRVMLNLPMSFYRNRVRVKNWVASYGEGFLIGLNEPLMRGGTHGSASK